jgi:allantoin racemase
MASRRRIVVLNPNTNASTTAAMVALARQACGANFEVDGRTAPFGSSFIIDQQELETSATAVSEMAAQIAAERPRETGLIVAAFGDAGLDDARRSFAGPLVGIGEAGLLAGAFGGRPFSIVTSTAGLGSRIEKMADNLGLANQLRSVRQTPSHPSQLIGKPQRLFAELLLAARQAVSLDGAQTIVIGGGPLARFAKDIELELGVPAIDPVSAAVKKLIYQWSDGQAMQPCPRM